MTNEYKKEILQKKLPIIRKKLGWTGSHLGSLLGVSKQLISIIENQRRPITTMQYLAILRVIDEGVKNFPDKYNLKSVKEMMEEFKQ